MKQTPTEAKYFVDLFKVEDKDETESINELMGCFVEALERLELLNASDWGERIEYLHGALERGGFTW